MSEEPFDVEKRTAQYVALRDKIKAMELKHEEELEPFQAALNKLAGLLLEHLSKTKANSVKTKAGTPYITDDVSVSIADKSAFWKWMGDTDNFEALDIRASKTYIKEYMEEQKTLSESEDITPTPPPGVNYSVRQKLCVMRGTKRS